MPNGDTGGIFNIELYFVMFLLYKVKYTYVTYCLTFPRVGWMQYFSPNHYL